MTGISIPDIAFGAGTEGRRTPAQHRLQVALRQVNETALYVDKEGFVHEQHVPPPYNGKPVEQGHTVVIWANGQLQISKTFADQGFTLYKEWCSEEPKKYELYRELMKARVLADHSQGPPVAVPDPSKLFPKRLLKRREDAEAGNITGKAWVPGDCTIDADKLEDMIKSLGIEPPKRKRS